MRRAEGILIVALMAFGTASLAEVQKCGANAGSSISTDRPQITESSIVVPCGSLQLENGVAGTAAGSQLSADFTESWLRFGIPAKGELRVGVPDYYTNDQTSAGFSSGFGDLTLGFKQQLGPAKGFDVSLIPSLSIPTGAAQISGPGYDPSLQIPWSRAMGKNWTAAGMFSVSWPTEPGGRNVTGQSSVYFDRQLTTPWDAWIEYSGSFPERGTPQNVLNMGTSYKPTPHQQIDFHWLVGLSAAAPDYSVGVGYSVRFQLIRAR
jgi:Putative MetA-pathway of phenol degradation